MAKGFNLGDYLKTDGVSKTNTRESIEYLPLELIDPDPENFYSLEGLNELAGNIELVGLQQPLRVRPLSVSSAGSADSSPKGGAKGTRYVIVSGHRRRAAIMLIRDGGSEQFKDGVPCIVERGPEVSKAMQELRLIYANSSTRVLSSSEISRQAERVTELLYKLKEEGVVFPGRMRDHVAQACQVSASKLARLHAIRENLIPELLEEYDGGYINESVAYRMSQEDAEVQTDLSKKLGRALGEITADTLDTCIAQEKQKAETAESGRSMTSASIGTADKPSVEGGAIAAPMDDNGPDAIDGLKKYLVGKSENDRIFWQSMEYAADSLILRSFAAPFVGPAARKESIDCLRLDLRNKGAGDGKIDWDGDNKGIRVTSFSPDGVHRVVRTWTEVYDALAAIAIARYRAVIPKLQKLERDNECLRGKLSKEPHAAAPDAEPQWMTGTPTKTGYYAAQLEFYGKPIASPRVLWYEEGVWYNAVADDIRQHKVDSQIRVVGWYPLPER